VRIEPEANRLVVGSSRDLESSECRVADINWINRPVGFPADVQVKIRYRHQAAAASLTPWDDEALIRIRFHAPQKAITPGQGAVFYDGDEVLGGGWIV
jgi:tRNA-specific 2-thiouridylase